jgi:hypothetical protein
LRDDNTLRSFWESVLIEARQFSGAEWLIWGVLLAPKTSYRFGLRQRVERKRWKVYLFLPVCRGELRTPIAQISQMTEADCAAKRRTVNAERRTANGERRTVNGER